MHSLCTLCTLSPKSVSELLCNQQDPYSFLKQPGVWVFPTKFLGRSLRLFPFWFTQLAQSPEGSPPQRAKGTRRLRRFTLTQEGPSVESQTTAVRMALAITSIRRRRANA